MEKKIIVFGSGKIRKEGIGNKRQAYSQKKFEYNYISKNNVTKYFL